jgi:hypothetical protein
MPLDPDRATGEKMASYRKCKLACRALFRLELVRLDDDVAILML